MNYVLKPKVGDTILVSGAAGAVGSVVGQVAKIMVSIGITSVTIASIVYNELTVNIVAHSKKLS